MRQHFGPKFFPDSYRPGRLLLFMKKYQIAFRLVKGNSGQQMTTVQASDSFTARRIFNQQNPGCKITSLPTEVRENATRR
jgi:hypothetical protein